MQPINSETWGNKKTHGQLCQILIRGLNVQHPEVEIAADQIVHLTGTYNAQEMSHCSYFECKQRNSTEAKFGSKNEITQNLVCCNVPIFPFYYFFTAAL